ncbi:MAG TPA: bacteriohemerythrin [Rhodocyclaceae bacterium]
MQWKKEYSIGIEVIDEQHQAVFERLLAIENALTKRDPWHVLGFLIDQLTDCLAHHLAVEGALLTILGYPQADEHRAAHELLSQAVASLESRLRNSRSPQDLVEFFDRWFVGHVLADDLQFVPHLRAVMARCRSDEATDA